MHVNWWFKEELMLTLWLTSWSLWVRSIAFIRFWCLWNNQEQSGTLPLDGKYYNYTAHTGSEQECCFTAFAGSLFGSSASGTIRLDFLNLMLQVISLSRTSTCRTLPSTLSELRRLAEVNSSLSRFRTSNPLSCSSQRKLDRCWVY